MGKASSLCGKFLGDKDLIYAAEEQLQWIVGKNPFAQSLMYGESIRMKGEIIDDQNWISARRFT